MKKKINKSKTIKTNIIFKKQIRLACHSLKTPKLH